MRTPLEIRNDALDCLRQADRAQARRHKAVLLILAQGWASLAEEMERRGLSPRDDQHARASENGGESGDDHSSANAPAGELQSAGVA